MIIIYLGGLERIETTRGMSFDDDDDDRVYELSLSVKVSGHTSEQPDYSYGAHTQYKRLYYTYFGFATATARNHNLFRRPSHATVGDKGDLRCGYL